MTRWTLGLCAILAWVQPCAQAQTVKRLGDVLQLALPAAALGSTYLESDAQGRTQFAKSFVATVAITEGLKYSVHETRPNGSSRSFPSGHTSVAFQSATFLQERYGSEWGIPAYALASLVADSRVHEKEHYWKDVVAGGLIGFGASHYFTTHVAGLKQAWIVPSVAHHGMSLSLWAPLD